MNYWQPILQSSVGKKILMALTGLGLIGFIMGHLIGNLTLFISSEIFNEYAHHLVSLGPLLYVAEAGIIGLFLLHVITGITLTLTNWNARKKNYKISAGAGGASRKTISSQTMIYTGLIVAAFAVVHVWMFKYGAHYETTVDGVEMRNLYQLVLEEFQRLPVMIGYVVCMIVLGFHLRHACWSAFQSLGIHHLIYTPLLYLAGTLFAILWAFGFLLIPIWIYFYGGGL